MIIALKNKMSQINNRERILQRRRYRRRQTFCHRSI